MDLTFIAALTILDVAVIVLAMDLPILKKSIHFYFLLKIKLYFGTNGQNR